MRTKPLNNNAPMSLIMENWRGFVAEDFDLSKIDEEYDAFCKAFDKYCLLNEAAQTAFLVQEAAMATIINFFKELAASLETSWKNLVAIWKAEDGFLWKVFKTIGWSLDKLAEMFHSGFKALNAIQDVIIEFAKDNPITGIKGQLLTDKIKYRLFKDPETGNINKIGIAGVILIVTLGGIFLQGTIFFAPAMVFAALAGKYAAKDLFNDNAFAKIVLSIASGIALNALIPGWGLFAGPAIGVLKKIVSVYRVGKFAASLGKETEEEKEAAIAAEKEKTEKEMWGLEKKKKPVATTGAPLAKAAQ